MPRILLTFGLPCDNSGQKKSQMRRGTRKGQMVYRLIQPTNRKYWRGEISG
jgi:hypothetical protein